MPGFELMHRSNIEPLFDQPIPHAVGMRCNEEVRLYAFDLLCDNGVDMRDETLQIRKLWLVDAEGSGHPRSHHARAGSPRSASILKFASTVEANEIYRRAKITAQSAAQAGTPHAMQAPTTCFVFVQICPLGQWPLRQ